MQRLEVSGAVRTLYGPLGIRGLRTTDKAAGAQKLTTHLYIMPRLSYVSVPP